MYGEMQIPGYNMSTPQHNGYFIRDDVQSDFAINHMGKNYDLVRSDRSCGDGYGNEESYDQVIAVHLALAMVHKLIPTTVTYQGNNIRAINHGIMIKVTDWISGFPGWVLRNPADGNTVSRGWEGGLFYAYPMSVTGRIVTGDNGRWRDWYSQFYGWIIWRQVKLLAHAAGNNVLVSVIPSINPYLGIVQTVTGQLIFGSAASEDNRNDNANMFLQVATASRSAGIYEPNPLNWINDQQGKFLINDMGIRYKKQVYNIFGSTLIGFDYGDAGHNYYWLNEFSKYPCACNCIYRDNGTTWPVDDSGCANLLFTTSAAFPLPNNAATALDSQHPYPWTTPNRWEHWRRNPIEEKFKEFDGIDYLEAFNAYMYKFHSTQGSYGRLRVYFGDGLPKSISLRNDVTGTPASPYVLKGVFDIYSRSTLHGSRAATASFYAGSAIDLLPNFYAFNGPTPGFDAEYGSTFEAAIRDYDCVPLVASHGIILHRSASGEADTSAISEVNYDDYSMDTTISIHHDDSSINFPDTINVAMIDTSIIYIRHSANGDTTFVGLQPCYAIGPNNELVNICDAQNRPLSAQKLSLNAARLYPVPARNELFLDVSPPASETLLVQIIDVLGRDVTSSCTAPVHRVPAGGATLRFNTSTLAPGTYLLRLRLAEATENRTFTIIH